MPTASRPAAMHLGVAVSACLLFAAAAMAAETKPIVSTKSKAAEIEVKVDDAFKAYPGLYDNLAAEGRKEAAAWRAEAEGIYRRGEDTFTFKDGRRYSYAREYALRSALDRYISVVRTDDVFTGGAHPNQSIDTILWDTQAKKRISIRPFFKETADNGRAMTAMAKLVRAAVFTEKKRRKLETIEGTPDNNEWLKDITPSLLKLGPVTLTPSSEAGKSSGLTFHFSPYMVGPYAEGSLTAFVAWTDFKDFLSPEGAAIFGGSRPEGDAKSFD
jgi:hypothetical protein